MADVVDHAREVAAVRARIARGALRESSERNDCTMTVGAFTLRPSQRTAVAAIRAAFDAYGGALLIDPPGSGKTVTALAIAQRFSSVLVVGPAAVRDHWAQMATRGGVILRFTSIESLSRGADVPAAALLIVDEAHHLRTPTTVRYARVAALAMHARVLLLSATPVVNRAQDRDALLALFLGDRGRTLDASDAARIVVRGEGCTHPASVVHTLAPLRCAVEPEGVEPALRALPPPFPTADGAAAVALIRLTLAMAWSSSLAALDAALRRRVQRGTVLADVVRDGRWPDRRALRDWVVGDDATQLALPFVLASDALPPPTDAIDVLETHLAAIRSLRATIAPWIASDTERRAGALRELLSRFPASRVVAFAQHAETIRAVWRALRSVSGVVAVTGLRVYAAQGRWPRDEVLGQLGPHGGPWRASDPRGIRLLLATDLLSEGIELQGVQVAVHLDTPWTPARLEQRVGRIARVGSAGDVYVTQVSPPVGATEILAMHEVHRVKRRARSRATGAAEALTQLHVELAMWDDGSRAHGGGVRCAVVPAPVYGFLALMRIREERVLVSGVRLRRRWRLSSDPVQLLRLVRASRGTCGGSDSDAGFDGTPIPCDEMTRWERQVRRLLFRWCQRRLVRAQVGPAGADERLVRILRRRLDDEVAHQPLAARAAYAQACSAVLAVLHLRPSVGLWTAIRDVLRSGKPSHGPVPAESSLLERLQMLTTGSSGAHIGNRAGFTSVDATLIACLMLRPRGGQGPSRVSAEGNCARSASNFV